MDKRSPLTWNAVPRTEAWNHRYKRPASAVKVVNENTRYNVSSRCAPHVNAVPWPPEKPVEDYSWIRSAQPTAAILPVEHPLSPEKLKEAERERDAAAIAQLAAEGIIVPERRSGTSRMSSFSKDNPNVSSFEVRKSKSEREKKTFGDVGRFTAHRMGGHYSSPTKTLLEVTRKDEIDLQKQRDVAEAKAKLLLSGGSLRASPGNAATDDGPSSGRRGSA